MPTAEPRSALGVRRSTVEAIEDQGNEKPKPSSAVAPTAATGPGPPASTSRPAAINIKPPEVGDEGFDAVGQSAEEEAGEQDHAGICGERDGSGVAVRFQMQDEEAGDYGVLHIDETDGDTRCEDGARQPLAGRRMRLRMIVLANACQSHECDHRGGHL